MPEGSLIFCDLQECLEIGLNFLPLLESFRDKNLAVHSRYGTVIDGKHDVIGKYALSIHLDVELPTNHNILNIRILLALVQSIL